MPGLGWTALRHAGCPLVATFHANPEKHAAVLVHAAAACAACSTRSTPPSPRRRPSRDAAALTFPGAYRVIPPGVDLERLPARRTRSAPGPAARALRAGVESRRKGLGVLLRALRLLGDRARRASSSTSAARDRQERRYARLVPPALRRTACASTGACRTREVRGAPARRADVFCAPSLGPETAGVALLEAMASRRGRRRLATRPATTRSCSTRATGLLVPPRDAARARRGAARACSATPSCASALAARRRCAPSRRYDWERVAGEILEASTTRWRAGGGTRCRAAAASSASCSPTSTSTRTTARTA